MGDTALTLRPQPGPQEKFLSSPADIIIYGGSAGGGKSWSILLEVLRGINNPNYNAVLFRRTYPMIRNPGGLWDASTQVFPMMGAMPRETNLTWTFPSGATCVMRHLKLERNVYDWQGSEIVYIAFDELTHFSESMFWYMLSRNRSTCGIAPYIRATCNPDSESWVRGLIDWWIGEDGLAIPDRSGVVRYFIREEGVIKWVDETHPDAKSLTFISASIFDNQELLTKDPGYLKNLRSLPLVDRERLLGGNWNVKVAAGKVFRNDWFEVVDELPSSLKTIRFWDFAGSVSKSKGHDPDFTVGLKLVEFQGIFYVVDVIQTRVTPHELDRLMVNTASQDGPHCTQGWWQDPGQAGQHQSYKIQSILKGCSTQPLTSQLDKWTRAKPASSAAEQGRLKLLRGPWNQGFLNELTQFPDGNHDDQVDALAGAYMALTGEHQLGRFAVGNFRT